MRVTSVDVARAAGVSQATVSHVLNPHAKQRVSDSAREAVLRAVETLGYRPHAGARALRLGRSDTVLMPLPAGVVARVLDVVVDVCGAALAEQGLTLVTDRTAHSDDAQRELAWLRLDPAAVIDLGLSRRDPVIESLRAAGIAIVSGDLPGSTALTVLDVISDQARLLQVRHLLERGFRSLVLALPPASVTTGWRTRLRPVLKAVKAADATFEIRTVDLTRDALREALTTWTDVDGICANNDEQAIGLLSTARQLGIPVPGQLGIVGLDDDPLSDVIGLSTVHFGLEDVGRSIADTTIALLTGGDVDLTFAPPTMEVQVRSTT